MRHFFAFCGQTVRVVGTMILIAIGACVMLIAALVVAAGSSKKGRK